MNSFGHFNENGSEYIITTYDTPRVLMNYMWNDRFFSGVNHFGGGEGSYIWTACFIDPMERGRADLIAGGNRYFYIRDEDSGEYWNPGWYPCKTRLDYYRCTHGLGYTVIEGRQNGISVTLRVYVNDQHPAEIWKIQVKNHSSNPRHLRIYSFVEFSLLGYQQYCGMQAYSYCIFDEERNMVVALNRSDEIPHEQYSGFICSSEKVTGYDSSKHKFIGKYNNISAPEVVVCQENVRIAWHVMNNLLEFWRILSN